MNAMKVLRKSLPLALCLALFGVSAAASAFTISQIGTSGGNPGGQPLYEVAGLIEGDAFNLDWGGVTGLDITGMLTVDTLTSTGVQLSIMLDNNSTPIGVNGDPRVTSFGLNINGFTGLNDTATGGTFLGLADTSNFPGFTTTTCATSGTNCAGGGSGGIDAGLSDAFLLDVAGSFGGSPTLTLSGFAVKVQGGPSGASFELAGIPTEKTPNGVPAPTVLGLLGIGLAALGFTGRVRRRTN